MKITTYEGAKAHITKLVRAYERKVMPPTAPRVQIIFTSRLPFDVLGEMQPYYNSATRRCVRVEMRFNADFIKTNLDRIGTKAVEGLIAHEMCHAKHVCVLFEDYMKQKNPHADDDVFEPCMCSLGMKKYRFGTHPDLVVTPPKKKKKKRIGVL